MRVSEVDNMADIFIPQLTVNSASFSITDYFLIALVTIFSLVLCGYSLWRYFNRPLKKLKRDLKNNIIEPRFAAHQLAAYIAGQNSKDFKALRSKLDSLRFQKQQPDREQLLVIIEQVGYGH